MPSTPPPLDVKIARNAPSPLAQFLDENLCMQGQQGNWQAFLCQRLAPSTLSLQYSRVWELELGMYFSYTGQGM